MNQTDEIIVKLGHQLDEYKLPIVAWSSGKDSMLLLYLVRKVIPNIPVLMFPALWTRRQKTFAAQIIEEWKLSAFFYRPNVLDYEQYEGGSSVIAYYPFGSHQIPVITDVVESSRCGLDKGREALKGQPFSEYGWDATLVGSKNCDSHNLVRKLNLQCLSTSTHEVITPLWDLTDDEVFDAILKYKIPIDSKVYQDGREDYDTGNFNYCLRCLNSQEKEVLCPKTNTIIPTIGDIYA